MYLKIRPLLVAATFLLASAGVSASSVLYHQLPNDANNNKASDYFSVTPYSQTIPSLGSITLDRISWWGFHTIDSLGPDFDTFEVFIDGASQSGNLIKASGSGLAFYTLDIPDLQLNGPSLLEIWNNSEFVEWWWAGSSGTDAAGDDATAYRLEGARNGQQIPEPGMLGLLGIGALALSLGRRKRL